VAGYRTARSEARPVVERLRWRAFFEHPHDGKPADDPFYSRSTQENTSD